MKPNIEHDNSIPFLFNSTRLGRKAVQFTETGLDGTATNLPHRI